MDGRSAPPQAGTPRDAVVLPCGKWGAAPWLCDACAYLRRPRAPAADGRARRPRRRAGGRAAGFVFQRAAAGRAAATAVIGTHVLALSDRSVEPYPRAGTRSVYVVVLAACCVEP